VSQDFFGEYLKYTAGGEVPICFHRWSAIVGVATILERNVHLRFGHGHIYPNMYTMLIGTAGTKKSTAIKLIKKLLIKAGYTHIAAERSSKEKYLADLSAQHDGSDSDDILDQNIFGASANDTLITPNFIAADEANDFFGIGNLEFLSVLGSLWDWEGKYENRIKTGKSDFIPNPTISILSGNTPTGFATGFPSSIFGQGFFSRLLLVYAEPTGDRITFPRSPTTEETELIVRLLQQIKSVSYGMIEFTPTALNLVDKIYQSQKVHEDSRFDSYTNRRLTHLLKLCLIVACARMEKTISETSVVQANTYLRYIERLMPKALGEFGKARNSDITHRVLGIIEQKFPIAVRDIFREVSGELEKPSDLSIIIQKLIMSDKIQNTAGGLFLPKKSAEDLISEEREGFVDFNGFLTAQELSVRR
jgi:hypothetical protein